MPIFWSPEELAELKGSYLLQQIAERKAAIEADYAAICRIAPALEKIATLDEFKWARMCVCSRNFGLEINRIRTAALVPYADMLNHFRPRETKWRPWETKEGQGRPRETTGDQAGPQETTGDQAGPPRGVGAHKAANNRRPGRPAAATGVHGRPAGATQGGAGAHRGASNRRPRHAGGKQSETTGDQAGPPGERTLFDLNGF